MDSSCKGLQSIFTFYKNLKNLLDWCLSEYGEPDVKARVTGIKTQIKSFDLSFGIPLGYLVQTHGDNLSTTLQTPNL